MVVIEFNNVLYIKIFEPQTKIDMVMRISFSLRKEEIMTLSALP